MVAEPTFYDMTKQAYRPAPSMGILTELGVPGFGGAVSDNQEYGREMPFQLYPNATSYANLELYLEQIMERINDYASANQRWKITSFPNIDTSTGVKSAIVACTEYSIIEQEAF